MSEITKEGVKELTLPEPAGVEELNEAEIDAVAGGALQKPPPHIHKVPIIQGGPLEGYPAPPR